MKAKYIPRIDIQNRYELKEKLPLETPYVIYIDPCDTCNFHCKFCPSGNLEVIRKIKGRGHGSMDFELYKRIIDALGEFNDPIKVIRLYKEGEPLLNPRFADMVRYAKASGYKLDFETYVENIAFFYEHRKQCELNIKINGDILTPEQEAFFYQKFGDITDGISVEHTIEYWPKYNDMKVDYDENVSLLGGKAGEVQVCPYVFYEMCINSDGSYSLCRFDWNHAMIMGKEFIGWPTPKKIWDSITLWNFQLAFLKKQRKMLCVFPARNVVF